MKDYLTEICFEINKINSLHYKYIKNNIESMPNDFKIFANQYLAEYFDYLITNQITFEQAINAYMNMIKMMMGEQLFFKLNKKYRYSSFEEVNDLVYKNESFFADYMIGLALSQFLFKNHYQLFSFFSENIKNIKGDSYLEIGPGHGLFLVEAIKNNKFQHYTGIDISETSIKGTKQIISKFLENSDRCNLFVQDAMKISDKNKYDFIVFGELLEHLENPYEFLQKIKKLLNKNGKAYFSTVANAPTIDHIYLFNSVGEIKEIVQKAGFKIEKEIIISVDDIPEEKWDEKKANVTYGAIIY